MPLTDLSHPDTRLRERWNAQLRHGADGTPKLPPAFVAEAGPRVWIIDVREDDELTGPQGHIPGVWRVPMAAIGEVARKLPAFAPVVLVCSDGARSMAAARYLLALGQTTVAAMAGGMAAWRSEGYGASRDPASVERSLAAPAPGHGSDRRPLDAGGKKGPLTREAIEEHVGDPAKVRRVKLAAVLLASQTMCVDGREDRAIIGTPGGDSGELLLGLAAVEQLTGRRVDVGHVPTLSRAFADTFGGIYLHTDNYALNALARALRADPRLSGAVESLHNIDDWMAFLRRPPAALQEALLEHLLQPDHIGCGHLKLALQNPDVYGIRVELLTAYFRDFYTQLWRGAPDLVWTVLGGKHAEGAVVNVTLEGELWPFSQVPMLTPSVGGSQMFVNHPQVVAYMRAQVARFYESRANNLLPLGKGDGDKLTEAIPELGGVQAGETLRALAGGLPTFAIHFMPDGTISVSEGEPIPG